MSGTQVDVDRLMLAVANGDRDSFAALYDATASAAFGIIRRVTRNQAMSEEVLQDVMLHVWRMAPRFDPRRGRASGWINTIAHRRAIDRVRSEEAARRRDQASERPDRPYDEVMEQVERAEDRSKVAASLSGLSDVQRQTIELSYYEGMTHEQISVHLDVPVNTIKTRMRDGLIRLRRHYEATA